MLPWVRANFSHLPFDFVVPEDNFFTVSLLFAGFGIVWPFPKGLLPWLCGLVSQIAWAVFDVQGATAMRCCPQPTRPFCPDHGMEVVGCGFKRPVKNRRFLSLSLSQSLTCFLHFQQNRNDESLLDSPPSLSPAHTDKENKLKVFSEYSKVSDHLKHPGFEITDSEDDADVLWLHKHFKDYK